MKKIILLLLCIAIIIPIASCSQNKNEGANTMSEPVKKTTANPESYTPKDKPDILTTAEENAQKQAESKFVRFNKAELITIEKEIKIVGLSYKKCTETGSVQLGGPFDLYGKFELLDKIKNIKQPETGYCVWLAGDLLNGIEVTDASGQDDLYAEVAIPAGLYLKLHWNAETFNELVMEAIEKSWERCGADEFMQKHNLVKAGEDDGTYVYAEVYPKNTVGKEIDPITPYPEMYTLRSVKIKE